MFSKKAEVPPVHIHSIEELEVELRNELPKAYTTTLDAHQLYLLRQSGLEPVGIAVGVIVYSMGVRGVVRSIMRAFQRGEMSDFSHFNQIAREVAIARMRRDAEAMKADSIVGVVGVHLETREYADFIEVVATGTAVKRVGDPKPGAEMVVGV